ncbi:MAG TPA: SPFH domain-containing protein [Vicinamibacteria bacterium]|nr:SPFH domain-containing protein [Vicinamibacteria bacterium]
MMEVLFVLALAALVIFVSLSVIVRRLLYVSAPNEALIFSGRIRQVGDKQVGYRVVRGGRALRIPFFELMDSVDLTNINIDIAVGGAYSKGGIPLNVHGVANVKLPGEEPLLNNAVERFLGKSRQDILRVAKETLEGNLRGVLAQLTPEEANQDKARFAQTLLEEAEHDLNRMGLVLDTLKIQNITDEVGYLSSIGRIQGARVRQDAAVAEARATADASAQQAQNWGASEIAKVDADLAIARQETDKRVADARTRRAALIAESQGQVTAQIAQVTAEIERQKARALQVKRRLDADVVQVAEADRRAAEEQARGAAARVIEPGRAEAAALKSVFEAYTLAGDGARDIFILQQVLPLLAEVSGSGRKLVIQNVTVLPAGGEAGDGSFAKAAISTNEQIKAATGIDLAAMAKRLQGGTT